MSFIKVDLHTHTNASFDCWVDPKSFAKRGEELGLGAVAITDHAGIDGALRVRDLNPSFQVIVGQEILSRQGEIIGLFLKEPIPNRLSAEETCDRVHEQGGLTTLPHPFAFFALDRLKIKKHPDILKKIDLIETLNARNLARHDRPAAALARKHGITTYAGSDCHMLRDLGNAYQLMRPFDGPADMLKALADAEPKLISRTFLFVSGLTALYSIPRFRERS